jgi:uncharacterized membrane protein YfcA
MHYLLYLIVGAVSGALAGLLGIGGGIVVVPALIFILPATGMPADQVVHVAVATSLATVIVTSSASTWAHHKRGAVQCHIVKRVAIILAVGIILGAILASYIPGDWLARLIALLILVIAVRMFFKKMPSELQQQQKVTEPRWRFFVTNILFGMLSAMLGMGGGTFLVPYLSSKLHCTMQQAVATSSACAVVIGFVATIIYIMLGLQVPDMPVETVGYIYWPAWLGIVISSTACARIGVSLAHRLPAKQLRIIFACLLLVVAVKLYC